MKVHVDTLTVQEPEKDAGYKVNLYPAVIQAVREFVDEQNAGSPLAKISITGVVNAAVRQFVASYGEERAA